MGRQVYQEDQFKVYRAGKDFIVHNSKYAFENKHSHIRNLRTAKQIIYYVKHRIIPRTFSGYLLESLVRVSDDAKYINDVQTLIEVRERKGHKQRYFNHRLAKA